MAVRCFTVIACAAVLVVFTSIGHAQMGFDGTMRMEFLFGHQAVRYNQDNLERFQVEFDPKVPVISGDLELTFAPALGARARGAVSVFETTGSFYKTVGFLNQANQSRWEIQPRYSSWEVAGLYHLYNIEGYRFSISGGYRQDNWLYILEPKGFNNFNSQNAREQLTAYVPFVGLQTTMYAPWWKARFEVLGSFFMQKRVFTTSSLYEVEAKANGGGMIEFRMEGAAPIRPNLFLGLNAAYSLQEMYGTAQLKTDARRDYNVYTHESLGRIGVDLNLLF